MKEDLLKIIKEQGGIEASPIVTLETSISNTAAVKTYESLGFVKEEDYAFKFL